MTGGPNERFGTNRLSITSRCNQSAPPCSQRRASAPSWVKSLARMEGAMRTAMASILPILHKLTVFIDLDPDGSGRPGRLDRFMNGFTAGIELAQHLVTGTLVGD